MMRRLAGAGAMPGAATTISRRLFKMLNDQGNREFEASLMYASASFWFEHNELPGSAHWCRTHSDEERVHAFKIFDHLASRRVEEGGKGTGGQGYGSMLVSKLVGEDAKGKGQSKEVAAAGQEEEEGQARQPSEDQLQAEQPPEMTTSFAWEETPNVVLDVKGPVPTAFDSPVAIWRSALEQERANSRRYFELMQAARDSKDFVTEHLLFSFFIPEQLAEEKAVEEIYDNALLVTTRGPDKYFDLDLVMREKPH